MRLVLPVFLVWPGVALSNSSDRSVSQGQEVQMAVRKTGYVDSSSSQPIIFEIPSCDKFLLNEGELRAVIDKTKFNGTTDTLSPLLEKVDLKTPRHALCIRKKKPGRV